MARKAGAYKPVAIPESPGTHVNSASVSDFLNGIYESNKTANAAARRKAEAIIAAAVGYAAYKHARKAK